MFELGKQSAETEKHYTGAQRNLSVKIIIKIIIQPRSLLVSLSCTLMSCSSGFKSGIGDFHVSLATHCYHPTCSINSAQGLWTQANPKLSIPWDFLILSNVGLMQISRQSSKPLETFSGSLLYRHFSKEPR